MNQFVAPIRQLDPGTYDVRQPNGSNPPPLVGFVYVEGSGDLRVEHWALNPMFASPTTTQSMDVRKATGSGHASLGAFLDAMRAIESPNAPFRYVRATCEYFTLLP
ncbi:MAG: hypothetical protein Q8P41_13000 [Pseudomonadota bacterium]|nr:hypothetical protein [Pseudomonadota bacterium]